MSMNEFPNKKDRIVVLILWLIFFTIAVSFSLFLLASQDIVTILIAAISIIGTIILTRFIKLVSKGYFLKYYFNKKEYNKLYNESVKKFIDADDEFIKEFKRRTKYQYYTTGKLFYIPTMEDDKWLLSNPDNLKGFIMLIEMLDKNIDNGKGFNGFIDDAFNLTHNGELIMQTLENQFLSGELRYLFFMVFLLTEFNLDDNGLLDSYTENVKKLRNELDDRYSPVLYGFRYEIRKVKDKLQIYENSTIKNAA